MSVKLQVYVIISVSHSKNNVHKLQPSLNICAFI